MQLQDTPAAHGIATQNLITQAAAAIRAAEHIGSSGGWGGSTSDVYKTMAEAIDGLPANTEIMPDGNDKDDNIVLLKELIEGAAGKAELNSTDLNEVKEVSAEVAEVMLNSVDTLMGIVDTLTGQNVGSVSILTEMAEVAVGQMQSVGGWADGWTCKNRERDFAKAKDGRTLHKVQGARLEPFGQHVFGDA